MMKTEAEIRAYIKSLKKDEDMMREIFRSLNDEKDKKRKEGMWHELQYLQRMRNALEWVLDEYP